MGEKPNGAEALVRTLDRNGIDVCFSNPGTSEMHFLAALESSPGIRYVPALFEGVVTGAADGFARMAGRPASTLLHLGPGLANGLSNLHNAIRAYSPIVNVIGDHATYHRHYDAPLTSDIEGAARPFSDWVRTTRAPGTVGTDAAEAIAVARSRPGRIASLILPADAAWGELSGGIEDVPIAAPASPGALDHQMIQKAAQVLRAQPGKTAIVLGADATVGTALDLAGELAAQTGADLLASTHVGRLSRGAGRPRTTRIPYPIRDSVAKLADYENFLLIGADEPVAFFAYPGKPSSLIPPGSRVLEVARPDHDTAAALQALIEAFGRGSGMAHHAAQEHDGGLTVPSGAITPEKLGALLGATLPEGAIVVDESITSGRTFLRDTKAANPHEWLFGTGGSIGYALPCALGASIASPDSKVVVLEGDGSGQYMPSALWSMARENSDALILILSNRRYEILRVELANMGIDESGVMQRGFLDIGTPPIDWVGLANAYGMEAARAEDMDRLHDLVRSSFSRRGPFLIEVML